MAIYERTAGRISNYPVLKMDKSSRNTVNAFKKSKNGVLFAAGTFWEGVDCPGDVLSSVVIVNLPFPVPTPVLECRKKSYEQLGDFIDEVIFPEMIIKLRQGIGRLIRSENDTGLVAILDYRAGENGKYHGRIAAALAQYQQIHTIEQIERWFRGIKAEEYFDKGAKTWI